MARDSDNANALVDGHVSVGAVGSTMPTDVTSPLDAALKDVGWLSDAGLGEAVSQNTNVKRGINGSIIRTIKTDDDKSFTFECDEKNAAVLGLVRPGSTPSTVSGVTTTHVKSFLGTDERAWVLEGDYGTYTRRICVPTGQAFLTNTIQAKPGDLETYQFRLDCYPAADGTAYIDITNNPAEAVS